MILYLQATTNASDLLIDFIEVRLSSGQEVPLSWDESNLCRDGTFSATYKGVCFGEDYANGRLDELRDMRIVHIELYSEEIPNPEIAITELIAEDDGKELVFDVDMLFAERQEGDCNG